MTFLALLVALFALVAVPSLQQPNAGYISGLLGSLYQGNCYDRCQSAYQRNPSSYMVNGCICSQYKFIGMGAVSANTCGYLDATCRATPANSDSVYAFTFDLRRQRCQRVNVFSRCVASFGVSVNLFQTFQECSRSCESSNMTY